jgi:hypothetical protein
LKVHAGYCQLFSFDFGGGYHLLPVSHVFLHQLLDLLGRAGLDFSALVCIALGRGTVVQHSIDLAAQAIDHGFERLDRRKHGVPI